jgi:hypothetical protein
LLSATRSANPLSTAGDFGTDDVKCLKQLEQENGRLKKNFVERDLEIEIMKEIAIKKVDTVHDELVQTRYAVKQVAPPQKTGLYAANCG